MIEYLENPWDLPFQHRYQEALELFDQFVRNAKGQHMLHLANRATAYLCLNRLSEALADYTRANHLAQEDKATGGKSSPYLSKIAAIHWLMGERDTATEVSRSAVHGLSSGRIGYADNAGRVRRPLALVHGHHEAGRCSPRLC